MKDDKPKVFKLKNQRVHAKKTQTELLAEMAASVARHYGYDFAYAYNELPYKYLVFLYNQVQKERAENFLLLNSVINGPNEKSKSKRNYRETIKFLQKLIEE